MSISADQRSRVRERAGDCCEYCRVSQSSHFAPFHVDHVVATKHGGTDTADNLCLACAKCNGYKRSNVAALDPLTRAATKLYDPRYHNWDDHFAINSDATLSGLTPEGCATILVLRMNDEERVIQRLGDLMIGDYPCR